MDLFRKHQEELQLKPKEIPANTESVAQRVKPPDQADGG